MRRGWAPPWRDFGRRFRVSTGSYSATCFSPTSEPTGSGCSRASGCGDCSRYGSGTPARSRRTSCGKGTRRCSRAWTAAACRSRPQGGGAPLVVGGGGPVDVPLIPAEWVAVIHNAGLCTTGVCVRPVVVFALPRGSGATGAAIRDDSIAWLANPNLNTVTRLNFLTGDTASFRVGAYPRAMALVGGRVFVASGNLVSGAPAGASWLNAFACCGVSTLDSIPLSATNARFLAVGDDSLLYVVAAGRAGHPEGKLSVVDPVAGTELVVINGLGDSPGAAAFHPSGRVLVASASEGILEVNTLTRSVTRGPGQGVKPGRHAVAGLAIDQGGRVYALDIGRAHV